ncbi:hypothetical protein ACR2R6_23460 (plasmid) [Methylocaldum gracile subsp. desertum]|uniref:hypothetical protein n=1 Tax=Methylocaldum sp. GT1BW TaxID=3438964 RepID=UPI003DA0DFE3
MESAARKKIDIIYQDILGEISELVGRIEKQKTDIANITEFLENHRKDLEAAFTTLQEETLTEIRQHMADSYEMMRRTIDANIAAESEAAKLDIKNAASGYLDEVLKGLVACIQQSLNSGVSASINEQRQAIENVQEALLSSVSKARKDFEAAKIQLIKGVNDAKERTDGITGANKWEVFTYGLIGSGVGGFLMVIAMLLRG